MLAKESKGAPAAHVRSYFPEALYINPEIITDREGRASIVIPTNIPIASAAIATSVADAFLASGGRNAGTPLDTASTPVIAVQPLANAVSRRNVVNGWRPAPIGSGQPDGDRPPRRPVCLRRSGLSPAESVEIMSQLDRSVGQGEFVPYCRLGLNPIELDVRGTCLGVTGATAQRQEFVELGFIEAHPLSWRVIS